MDNTNFKSLLKRNPRNSKRQELEVNFFLVVALGLAITVAIYVFLLPFKQSPLGIILYERGFTQYLTVGFTSIVVVIIVLKFLKIRQEYQALGRIWIAEHIPLDQPDSPEIANFQQRLAKDNNLVGIRCSRILGAYIESGDRAAATEFALDDSSFYQSNSEYSYSFPRILVWAIPLFGFLGTVFGISQAVGGFSGVLEQAEDIDKIKEGITNVTTGLGVAFDTTLLALLLSIIIMIPLVLVERYESRLLLGIDIFINDKLLPRLRDKNKEMNAEAIEKAVKGSIGRHFPNPEILIEPAHQYAQEAAQKLATGFIAEISKVQNISTQVIEQVAEMRQIATKDRHEFMKFFSQQQQVNQELIEQIKHTVTDIRIKNETIASGVKDQTGEIRQQSEQAAIALESLVVALEKSANKIAELQKLQKSLDSSLRSLEKTGQLEEVLIGIRENLARLEPILNQMNKPRRITFIEHDNGHIPFSETRS